MSRRAASPIGKSSSFDKDLTCWTTSVGRASRQPAEVPNRLFILPFACDASFVASIFDRTSIAAGTVGAGLAVGSSSCGVNHVRLKQALQPAIQRQKSAMQM